ncbi:MAG: hypothetical protein KAS32_06410 [Candidatus Peribacteraceae bacterium]|nr:hypothetical protein [Candidatus Peribacteraceae bacterium]
MDKQQLIDGEWNFTGDLQIAHTRNSLQVTTGPEGGSLRRPIKNKFSFSVISVSYSSTFGSDTKIIWKNENLTDKNFYLAPATYFPVAKRQEKIKFSLDRYKVWNGRPTLIGFRFPPNTKITINEIELVGWNLPERIVEMAKSFWTMDDFRSYSINFIWGPRLTYNPIARQEIFQAQPPPADSANKLFYILFLITALTFIILVRLGRIYKKSAISYLLIFVAAGWIFYDFRMGVEFFNYLKTDYNSYYSKELGERTFRDRLFFYDFAEDISKITKEKEEFIFLAKNNWPYLGIMRYYAYPVRPVDAFDGNANKVDTWIVYRRPDIQIIKNQLVTEDGTVLSPEGSLIHEYEKGTFIFQSDL